jgi:site-specific DNA recombinase
VRAVIYCRVSTVEQTQNLSLSTQEKACRDYCARNDYDIDQVFVDAGESAKTTDRPEFLRLLTYCREHKGQLRAVIVYSLTRFSRNSADHHAITTLLRGLGITLRSVTEPIDESPSGRLMEGILAAMAQFDNDVRSERVTAGMKAALERGRWVFMAPIGYANANSRLGPSLVPDPARAPAVREAFELCAAGVRGRALSDRLFMLGLRTQKGHRVSPNRLYEMLRHRVYAGYVAPKLSFHHETRGDFEPLVSEELFGRVQAQLSQHARMGKVTARHRNHPEFPLRRFVRCATCRQPLTGGLCTGRGGKRYPHYNCRKGCTRVSKQVIEPRFLELLDALAPQVKYWPLIRLAVLHVWREEQQTRADARAQMQREQARLETQLARLDRTFIYDGHIDEVTYRHERDRLRQEIAVAKMDGAHESLKEAEVEGLLAFAEHTMQHASALWTAAVSVHERMRVQWLIFPAGLTWDPLIESLQRPVSLFEFFELRAGEAKDVGMVDHSYPTSNRLAALLAHLAQHRRAA